MPISGRISTWKTGPANQTRSRSLTGSLVGLVNLCQGDILGVLICQFHRMDLQKGEKKKPLSQFNTKTREWETQRPRKGEKPSKRSITNKGVAVKGCWLLVGTRQKTRWEESGKPSGSSRRLSRSKTISPGSLKA